MAGVPPPLAKAIGFYKEENRLVIEQGDMIALIDERPDLSFIKGQNQRSFDIGTFPRFVISTNIYADSIEKIIDFVETSLSLRRNAKDLRPILAGLSRNRFAILAMVHRLELLGEVLPV